MEMSRTAGSASHVMWENQSHVIWSLAINLRKEFFRASIDEILAVVKEHQGEVEYVVDPEALQYRQSIEMTDEDQEFIEQVYDELEDDAHVADD